MYRDGCGEGQFREVLKEEMGSIKQACKSLSEDFKPKITFIVVAKRHNTRFYPMYPTDKGVGRAMNVQPGVVLDHTIISPDVNDFYLCSHFGIQGTSRPAKYSVLHDDSDFSADELHMITYCTTFVYQRCSRAVSIPGPTYYAHLACERARNHAINLRGFTGESSSGQSGETISRRQFAAYTDEKWHSAIRVGEGISRTMYFV